MSTTHTAHSNIAVYDNFLPTHTFESIRERMLADTFPWFYKPYKSEYSSGVTDELREFQFVHTFYVDDKWNSPFLWAVEPTLTIIDPEVLIRIKANLTTNNESVRAHAFHRDFENSLITTAILYLTDCDGGTMFANGQRIESVANRFVEFNSQLEHAAESFTNTKVRCVINFNYVK